MGGELCRKDKRGMRSWDLVTRRTKDVTWWLKVEGRGGQDVVK